MTARRRPRQPDRDVVPRLLRARHGHGHHRDRRRAAGDPLARRQPLRGRRRRVRRARRARRRPARRSSHACCSRISRATPGFAFLTSSPRTNVLGARRRRSTAGGGWPEGCGGAASCSGWCSCTRRSSPSCCAATNPAWAPHQRNLVLADRVDRVGRRRRRAAPRHDRSDLLAFACLAAFTPRRGPVPDRHDAGVPALDVPPARSHRSRSARLDRGRRGCDHRARRIQPARRRERSRRGSNASHRSWRVSSSSPGLRRRSGSR